MKALFAKPLPVFLIMLLFGCFSNIRAQADSAHITYSSENSDSSDYNYHRKYQYLDINLKDEPNMFKIAVPAFTTTHFTNTNNSDTKNNYGVLFSFEKKLNKVLSVYVENENDFIRVASALQTHTYEVALNWGARYYFLMKNRIKEGVSGNNCNGVYVDFGLYKLNRIKYVTVKVIENSKSFAVNDTRLFNSPDLTLNLGLQKRLNNFSYIDSRLFLSYTINRSEYEWDNPSATNNYVFNPKMSSPSSWFVFGVEFKIGLGWGWKKFVVY
jgi:hypothetical protein